MGWISKRHMQQGGSIGTGPKGAEKYPLRKIVQVLRHSMSMFEPDHVKLECGHEGPAWGQLKARCKQCWEEQQKQ